MVVILPGDSVQEKYEHAYWLRETIIRHVLAEAPPAVHPRLLKAYYSNNMNAMEACLRCMQ
jgi:hypothetical protein